MTQMHTLEAEAKQPGRAYHESRAISFWLNFFFFFARRTPLLVRWSRPFWMMLSRHFFVDYLRGGIRKNTHWLLGPDASEADRRALTDRVLEHFYMFIHDIGRAGGLSREQLEAQIDAVEGEDHFHEIRKLKRGAIIATAHMGSFEVGAAAVRSLEPRVHVAFQHDNLGAFDAIRHRLHEKLGLIEAVVDQGWSAWLQVRDALLNDEVVLIQADRTMPGQHGVAVPFMGGHLLMPLGPIKLAVMTGAPIVPVFAIRLPSGKVRLVIESPIVVDAERDRPRDEVPGPAMLQLTKVIEKQVRAHPEQWLMLHPAWMEDQAGGVTSRVGAEG
ncbi:lysophospholipid acyltransferase family protein [Phycisphaerales bacterium AB-hyl4]|uniref:Lysophospholipid acyltransferase family protein n=1 Tax=Natronomicrosphaera hydrolytica TaxID=3242702 RepID=A0ABV4U5C7_9BACT